MRPRNAVVIGGGPAGLSAALGLIKSGWEVTLAEQRTQWAGRVCGSYLNPEAARHLRWLGLWDAAMEKNATPAPEVRLTTSFGMDIRIPVQRNGDTALAFPRKDMEELLSGAFTERGGTLLCGARATAIDKEGDRFRVQIQDRNVGEKNTLLADLAVVAGGRFSFAAETPKRAHGWFGWHASFENIPQKAGELSLHFYPGGYVGTLTFPNGETNVCGLVHRADETPLAWQKIYDNACERQPLLQQLMTHARRTTEWQGVGPLPFSLSMRPNAAGLSVGDEAAVGDPFAGEGIGRALGAGPMLHQTLRLMENAGGGFEEMERLYHRQWRGAYGARLRIGFGSRLILRNTALFQPLLSLLFREGRMVRRLLPFLHAGYYFC